MCIRDRYQVITLMTTNGQAPFITVFMYLNEVSDPQTKADLAAIIEEMLCLLYTSSNHMRCCIDALRVIRELNARSIGLKKYDVYEKAITRPVSYTHLDVYKRQILCVMVIFYR